MFESNFVCRTKTKSCRNGKTVITFYVTNIFSVKQFYLITLFLSYPTITNILMGQPFYHIPLFLFVCYLKMGNCCTDKKCLSLKRTETETKKKRKSVLRVSVCMFVKKKHKQKIITNIFNGDEQKRSSHRNERKKICYKQEQDPKFVLRL